MRCILCQFKKKTTISNYWERHVALPKNLGILKVIWLQYIRVTVNHWEWNCGQDTNIRDVDLLIRHEYEEYFLKKKILKNVLLSCNKKKCEVWECVSNNEIKFNLKELVTKKKALMSEAKFLLNSLNITQVIKYSTQRLLSKIKIAAWQK